MAPNLLVVTKTSLRGPADCHGIGAGARVMASVSLSATRRCSHAPGSEAVTIKMPLLLYRQPCSIPILCLLVFSEAALRRNALGQHGLHASSTLNICRCLRLPCVISVRARSYYSIYGVCRYFDTRSTTFTSTISVRCQFVHDHRSK
jgi:hypothetical protein